ncbi:MAG: ARMT1-like domain-containing protein [candidate division WOR-3 bacterium]
MRSSERCFECGLRQCVKIAVLTGNQAKLPELLSYLRGLGKELDLNEPPGTYTSWLLLATMKFLKEPDPFKKTKSEQNRHAQELAAQLEQQLGEGDDALKRALLLSAAGNVIDVGPERSFDINQFLSSHRFTIDHTDRLLARLKRAQRIVYLLDNSGEVLFDRLVLKRLPKVAITIVAKSSPILNDVTVEEAKVLGLEEFGRVIGTGSPFLGVDLKTVSKEFRQVYSQADLVIAKGHANFESLVDEGRDGYYVLTAKCELVANRLGIGVGESVCYYSRGKGE